METTLSHKNHFKFGYNQIPFNFRISAMDKWWVSYGRCERPTFSFKDECLQTAKQIQADANQNVTVLFSGGADSEVALQSFLLANIPVRAAILRFKNDLNIHDISYAVIACEKLGVPYYFFDLDLIKFWENQLFEYANPTYCISPQLLTTMWLVDQVDEYPVLGSGECLLVKRIPNDYLPGISPYEDSEWDLYEKEKIAAWYRHFIVKNRNGCPGFFQYNPEIILSYLLDPFVQRLTDNQITGKLCTASSKLKIYQQHFDLIDRPKFSGFEKVQHEDSNFRKILTEAFPHAKETYMSNVQQLKESMIYHDTTGNARIK